MAGEHRSFSGNPVITAAPASTVIRLPSAPGGASRASVRCWCWGMSGWFVMGVLFAGAGLLIPSVVRWAEAARPQPVRLPEAARAAGSIRSP